MPDDLVSVYQSQDLPEAEMLRQRLADSDIDAIVEPIASPLDGLTAANQGTHVRVREQDAARAREILKDFLAEETD